MLIRAKKIYKHSTVWPKAHCHPSEIAILAQKIISPPCSIPVLLVNEVKIEIEAIEVKSKDNFRPEVIFMHDVTTSR